MIAVAGQTRSDPPHRVQTQASCGVVSESSVLFFNPSLLRPFCVVIFIVLSVESIKVLRNQH
jgi:hypothetical protein